MKRERDDDDDGDEGVIVLQNGEIREQDRFLPVANIARIMKKVLPSNHKIAKESKESIQECVSEFISFITSEASDKCQQEKRKTINGDDILWAMSTLGFDKYVDPLMKYLNKYRESVKGEKPEKKQKTDMPPGAKAAVAESYPMYATSSSVQSLNSSASKQQAGKATYSTPMPKPTVPSSAPAPTGYSAGSSAFNQQKLQQQKEVAPPSNLQQKPSMAQEGKVSS
jgi:nuclear transcription Y subunit beta